MSFAWATYSRVSREDEGAGESDSCARQTADAVRFANSRGATSIRSYTDDGVSGAALQRPALDQLMADARAGLFHRLAIRDIDRLSRDAMDLAWLLVELRRSGVFVVTYTDGADVSLRGVGGLITTVKGFFAAEEREKAKERTRAALRDRAKAGHATGRPLLGYKAVPAGDGSTRKALAIDDDAADFVRHVAKLFVANGGVFNDVARALNRAGRRTPYGKAWVASRIRELLENPLYRGVRVHGQRGEVYDANGRKRVVDMPAGNVVRVEMPHLRILDPALAAKVDKLLASPRYRTWNGAATPTHLASRFLRCAKCGLSVCATASHYRCRLHHQAGNTGCVGISARPIAEVDAALIDGIAPLLDGDIAERALRELHRQLDAEARGVDREAEESKVRAQLAQAERRAANYADLIGDGDKSPTIRAKLAAEENKAAEARAMLALLTATAPARVDVARAMREARAKLQSLATLLRQGGVAARPVLQALLGAARITATPVIVNKKRRWELTASIAHSYVFAGAESAGAPIQRTMAAPR